MLFRIVILATQEIVDDLGSDPSISLFIILLGFLGGFLLGKYTQQISSFTEDLFILRGKVCLTSVCHGLRYPFDRKLKRCSNCEYLVSLYRKSYFWPIFFGHLKERICKSLVLYKEMEQIDSFRRLDDAEL